MALESFLLRFSMRPSSRMITSFSYFSPAMVMTPNLVLSILGFIAQLSRRFVWLEHAKFGKFGSIQTAKTLLHAGRSRDNKAVGMSIQLDESENILENNKLECTALLFDLDGVLINSSQCITRHWQAWAERHGLDIEEIMQVAHGLRAGDTMRRVAPHLDVETEEREYLAVEENDHEGVVAIEGAGEMLRGLAEGRWAIVTSAPYKLASRRLRHVGLPIPELMVTAEDVREGKPSPEPYLAGAEKLGTAARDCVVIEDATAGILAGKRAGMRVIGVAVTHRREALLQAGADAVVGRLSELRIRVSESDHRLIVKIG